MADAVADDDEVNVEDEVEISVPIPAVFSLSTLMLWRITVRPMSRMKKAEPTINSIHAKFPVVALKMMRPVTDYVENV